MVVNGDESMHLLSCNVSEEKNISRNDVKKARARDSFRLFASHNLLKLYCRLKSSSIEEDDKDEP